MTVAATAGNQVLQTLCAALHASAQSAPEHAPPAAVLWPDPGREWEPLLPLLREKLPLLTLGAYDPSSRTGPAIWLRCLLERALPEADWPARETPVLYLPGVGCHELRAVSDGRSPLAPLVELLYRGAVWASGSGQEWTPAAFLRSIGVEVASDVETKEALRRALVRLAEEPVAALRAASPLQAGYFHTLLNPDLVRKLLLWLNDPPAQRAAMTEAEWGALCAACRQQFTFDPETEGEVTGASWLGGRAGAWEGVWLRYAEAPARYPKLPDLLRRARPAGPHGLYYLPECWPQENEQREAQLRALLATPAAAPDEIRAALRQAEATHGGRRSWVWAELDRAPLAGTLPALLALAAATEKVVAGADLAQVAESYAAEGWQADAAFLDALAAVRTAEDLQAVRATAEALYAPWLRASVEAFQALADPALFPKAAPGPVQPDPPGRCLLFADGLRMDLAQRLAARLREAGREVAVEWRLGALPPVTPTAKLAHSPVAPLLRAGPDLGTATDTVAKVEAGVFRTLLSANGYQVLAEGETGSGTGPGWTESGRVDSLGHNYGIRLAEQVRPELEMLARRIEGLLAAGWKEVRVITDHGWLLLPSGLPKQELPEHLTELRKGRCAQLKPFAQWDGRVVPWYWDPQVRIAVASGICCFTAGKEYEHGGLSPQECVVPVLTVTSGGSGQPAVAISSVRWRGLRCEVQLSGASIEIRVDLRTKPADPATSVAAAPKPPDPSGRVSLICPDDTLEGSAAVVVVLAAGDPAPILAQQPTIIGGGG